MNNIEQVEARLRGLSAMMDELVFDNHLNKPTPRYIKGTRNEGIVKITDEKMKLNIILNQLKAAVRRSTFQ